MNDLAKINAYLESLTSEKRAVLDDWRVRIKTIVPDAVEVFTYGMPAFKWRGKGLVGYAAAKRHFGYYPMSSRTIVSTQDRLKHFKTSLGAIQFTKDNPLTDTLLRLLLDTRQAEITEGQS